MDLPTLRNLEARNEAFLAERLQKNTHFFSRFDKRIANALNQMLLGKSTKYRLLFSKNDINIINLESSGIESNSMESSSRESSGVALYPKGAFIDFSLQIANNPLNNPAWSVFSNNLYPHQVEIKKLHITSSAINEIFASYEREMGEIEYLTSKMVDLKDSSLDSKIPKPNLPQNPPPQNPLPQTPSFHLPHSFLPQSNIFGLCGGLFLQILLESGYHFHSLLIFEEDLELFAISCYFVDYELLFSRTSPKSCYIFIENLVDKAFLNHYFYSKKITNNFLRLELGVFKSSKIESFKALVNEAYKANSRGWGSFEDELIGFKNTLKNIQKYRIFKGEAGNIGTKTSKNNSGKTTDKKPLNATICVVGSGPSLEENIEFLQKNQDKMLIFSCGTAIRVLQKHKIHIDFHIEIERVDYLGEILKSSDFSDCTLIAASVVDSNALGVANNTLLFLRGGSAGSYLVKNFEVLEFCAPFVGNAGFSLAAKLSDNIILCGLDCGYIEGYSKHSKGSFYGDEEIERPPNSFEVRGNKDLRVWSDSIFSLSRESLELSIKHYKPKKVQNIGLGAFIIGTEPKNASEIKLEKIDKSAIKSQLMQLFDISKDSINNGDFLRYINDLKAIIKREIHTKQELFVYIDSVNEFLSANSFKMPQIGILFEGSISHLLQNMLVCAISLKSNRIERFCTECVEILHNAIDEFIAQINNEIPQRLS